MTAYRKSADGPKLKLTRSGVGPHITSPEIAQFRAKVFMPLYTRRASWGGIGRRRLPCEEDIDRVTEQPTPAKRSSP